MPVKNVLLVLVAWSVFMMSPAHSEGDDTAEASGAPGAVAEAKAFVAEKIKAGEIDKASSGWRTKMPKFKALQFDADKAYFWHLKTSEGDIKLKFNHQVAPNHVANFIYLTEAGYFDDLIFHRVIPGFMAQGGCPLGRGNGGPGYLFAGEFDASAKHNKAGILSMANRGPNTDGSQFFITFKATPHLDGKHTVFGEVVDGDETLGKLEAKGSGSGRTSEKLTIEKATVSAE